MYAYECNLLWQLVVAPGATYIEPAAPEQSDAVSPRLVATVHQRTVDPGGNLVDLRLSIQAPIAQSMTPIS